MYFVNLEVAINIKLFWEVEDGYIGLAGCSCLCVLLTDGGWSNLTYNSRVLTLVALTYTNQSVLLGSTLLVRLKEEGSVG